MTHVGEHGTRSREVANTDFIVARSILPMSLDSSLAAVVATTPFDSRFDPRQWRHLIHAHLVSQLQKLSQRGAWGCELVLQQSANFAEAAKSRRPLFFPCFCTFLALNDFPWISLQFLLILIIQKPILHKKKKIRIKALKSKLKHWNPN